MSTDTLPTLTELEAAQAEHWTDVLNTLHRAQRPMSEVEYQTYLKSDQWRQRAEAAKQRAHHRCQVCYSPDDLEAHHRTYKRLGWEHPMDLTVMCGTCHGLFSEHGRLKS